MKKKLKEFIKLISVNWKVLFEFELIYKILSLAIFTPLFWGMFNIVMKLTGFSYLTKENIAQFVKNPINIICLLIIVICMTVYSMVDIGAIIYILDQSYQSKKVNIVQVIKFTFKNSLRIFRGKNIMLAFVVLFMIPFLKIGVTTSFISSLSLPAFIMDYVINNRFLAVPFLIVLFILALLLYKWLYAFHYFTLENCDFKEARQKSAGLSHKMRIKDFITLIILQLICYVLYLLFLTLAVSLAVLLSRVFEKLGIVSIVAASVVWVSIAVSLAIFTALSTPISYACISLLFYSHKQKNGECIIRNMNDEYRERTVNNKRVRIVECVVLLIAVVCCSFYMHGVTNGKFSLNIEYVRTMDVTAHRGASAYYPENTMSAFIGVVELGADWVELDVQQTKDGQIIVMHDTNLLRTTGMNKNIWEVDYAEIQDLSAGSWFHEAFTEEKIPLLSEVIAFAIENHVKLNIELKPTGYEVDFEKSVVDMIREYDFYDECVITSQAYKVVENVKAYDEDVVTVYVMSLAYGDINALTAADHFSIEATSVTKKLVSRVHNAGKQLYVWTVNTEDNINKMIELNVDNIITDDVILVKECIFASKTSDVITELVKILTR